MASNDSQSPTQMAAIFSCEMCPLVYSNPSDLDHHREIHDFDRNRSAKGAKARDTEAGPADIERAGSEPANAGGTEARPANIERAWSEPASESSASGSSASASHEQSTPMQHPQLVISTNTPVQPSHSAVSRNMTFTPPPTPGGGNPPRMYLSWLDSEVNSLENFIAYLNRPGGAINNITFSGSSSPGSTVPSSLQEIADADSALLRRRLPQEAADVNPSGSNSPTDVPLESLRLLFQAGGIPRKYEAAEDLAIYLPGIELLKSLSSNYLFNWQEFQPVFHIGTWNFNECPIALLGAMACFGSVFSGDSEMIDQGQSISSECAVEIGRMADLLPTQGQQVEYIAALCIYELYLIGSGEMTIHHRAERSRAYMINMLRNMNLLGPNADNRSSIPSQPSESPESMDTEWRAWVHCEQKLRVAWMVFEYDCSLTLFTTHPWVIELGHLPKRLPCDQALYDAPDADTWAAMRSLSPSSVQGPLVSDVVATAWTKSQPPPGMSAWGIRLCSLIFERLFRGLSDPYDEPSTMAGAEDLGLILPSASIQIQTKLLGSSSFLCKEGLLALFSEEDGVHFRSAQLSRHYDLFRLLPRVMNLIMYVARTAALPPVASYQGNHPHKTLRAAQELLIQEFAAAPYISRQYIWRAGQILRDAREYPAIAPVDHLRIFTAYLAVIAFAKYGPPSPQDESETEPFVADSVMPPNDVLENFFTTGGPASIGSCAYIYPTCSTEEIMEDACKQLYNHDCWGITKRFFNILVYFNALRVLQE